MEKTTRMGDQIINRPQLKQEDLVERTPFKLATTSRVQQKPHQPRQGGPRKQDMPKRQFTEINMPLAQALHHMLETKLVTLRDPPQKPNTSAPNYKYNERCAYHSSSPGHDTNQCWTLKNKIQDLIDEGALEFTQDGQLKFFYHPSKTHHLK